MKKMILSLIMMLGLTMNANAQYYPVYSYNYDMALYNMYQASMAQLNWQMQQYNSWNTCPTAPGLGTYGYGYPGTNTYYMPDTPKPQKRTRVERCTNCLGRGYNIKYNAIGDKIYETKLTCHYCHGKGQVKETYYE